MSFAVKIGNKTQKFVLYLWKEHILLNSMEKEIITAIALGIGLSASAGFRIFVPLLIAGLAGRFGFLPLDGSFEWMTTIPILIVFGVATIVEIGAYYIPVVDNLLDTIALPFSIAAGTILAASLIPADSESLRWILGLIIGGGISGTIQGGKSVLRLVSTGTTGGLANPVFSTGENTAAVGIGLFTLLIPVLIGIAVLFLIYTIVRKLLFRKRKPF